MTLILGIDDAGRGPVIGPLILGGVLLTEPQEEILKKEKIRDSKQIPHSLRKKMAKKIKENIIKKEITITHAVDLDETLKSGTNLNQLEAIKTAEIINNLNDSNKAIKVIIDCPSSNIFAWRKSLLKYIKHPANLTIKCEHKADANHISVAAASILAKTEREKQVDILKKQYGDFGSGYASDPRTRLFLKEKGQELASSGLFRKTWATWKRVFPDKNQKTLSDF